ncbi:phosphoenolpyruvate carboxykinase (ATP) [Mucilaginibacter phyllosphaerae]|uniref:Phosphoenolpyruvate carboxykinase (ATP) n=1 Tax=Mucilaginibacter phyllosphaerae TaxID=1812349 RepID=A0A4Y8AF28_9SPHI|nr:phosphoenolpyruvate carboxykinase (ATP) [Mucilaginibacter phyllosphaerae]MBB3970314.1 phosphoenolpyruvate carboxykinase (ATP) [Mucilaginibacter phyllosphaerae]TEW66685.1 phosphoenolpyruvate carboxykinase (ATP) [Mucilaginibacter phyllosphaerae]GGH11247.1 phosphoenolpyruvate carboxykinase [ATP] 1 [Mucilaginibacter phyllosphaerae]
MNTTTKQLPDLGYLNLGKSLTVFYQLTPAQLVEAAIKRTEGVLSDTGALAIDTGKFTGRSPKDRFIVDDHVTHDAVWWGSVNFKFDGAKFNALYNKVTKYLAGKEIFVRDACACANEKYHIDIRVVTETAYQNLFVHHLFIRPEIADPESRPEWTIIAAPGFTADPETDGTRQPNFSIISFSKKIILIGGTGYTGEIKKGIFSVLNFILPHDRQVLSMHCAANTGVKGDTAIFFGLSGTGKTTLSADPGRSLIGDDEHGWSDHTIFNFEGGCYAKCTGLTAESEPEIFNAVKYGALLENINFIPGTRRVNYNNTDKTENTRVAYPLTNVSSAVTPSIASSPQNIFFLTADAFGVLPPISKLTPQQAMYHFLSGYTAKIAGTETGITEPVATFSACFGEAFLPLHPVTYANLLGKKIKEHQVNVWLVNTGWAGGGYGVGRRIKLAYTRAMINAAISGALNHADYHPHPVFNMMMPRSCPNVPDEILNPVNTWANAENYEESANKLANAFVKNFEKYASYNTAHLINAGPNTVITV